MLSYRDQSYPATTVQNKVNILQQNATQRTQYRSRRKSIDILTFKSIAKNIVNVSSISVNW